MVVGPSAVEDETARRAGNLLMMKGEALAKTLHGEAEAPEVIRGLQITKVGVAGGAEAGDLVFAQDVASLEQACASRAGIILASDSLKQNAAEHLDLSRVLWTHNARLAFARAAKALQQTDGRSEVDATAQIAPSVSLGEGVRIGPGVVIEENVVLGDGCEIAARVVICSGTALGARVVVKAGAVLGSAGFGFVRDEATGEYVQFPQQGRLEIEDDVWIGANATIDRGALGETRIGRGTKIDNLVHIAHNCTIGKNVVIAAQTGVAGSSTIGEGAVVAGQVGIADHVYIGEGVILGAKAGVPSNKRLEGKGQVFWGIPARPIQQYLRELASLKRKG